MYYLRPVRYLAGMKTFFILLSILGSLALSAQSISGKWKTIDDSSGKPRSVVEIYEKEGKYFGKIIKLFRAPGEDPDPVCDECPGKRKDQKVIGMEIITGLEYEEDSEEYEDGEILDPENGELYDCKLWLSEEGNLKVRGYLLFFFRTQTWLPYEGE